MLCFIAKWYISRAIDCNRSLPTWVERRLTRDPSLKQFYDQSQRLAARLRSTEPTAYSVDCDHVQDLSLHHGAKTSSNRSILVATMLVGLAAMALLAITPFFNNNVKVLRNEVAESKSTSKEDSVGAISDRIEPEQVRELVASGRSLIERLKQGSDRVTDAGLESDFGQLAALANLDIEQAIQPVSDLGTNYGELLSQFDQHAETENRHLLSGGIKAWYFFVQKLPQSAASMAGL